MGGFIANVEMAEAWDGAEGRFWAEHQERFDSTIRRHHERLLAAAAFAPGEHVLDVGCGNGQTTRDAARAARQGAALGVDLSGPMLAKARRLAQEEGLTNVRFEQADAQVHPFPPGTYDLVMSRFGVMFFADPVAAFRNIAAALRPGGRLAVMVWQPMDRNEWILALRSAVAVGRDLPAPPPGAPGPFGLADPDHTGRILAGAGFADISFAGVEERFRVGADAEDAYRFTTGIGVVQALLADLDDNGRREALEALRATAVAHESPDGVVFGSAAWIVTATRP